MTAPLETTIAYEQTAIEVTAALAHQEPDLYLAQVYRFGLLEDFERRRARVGARNRPRPPRPRSLPYPPLAA